MAELGAEEMKRPRGTLASDSLRGADALVLPGRRRHFATLTYGRFLALASSSAALAELGPEKHIGLVLPVRRRRGGNVAAASPARPLSISTSPPRARP